jgi:hypothetical protein
VVEEALTFSVSAGNQCSSRMDAPWGAGDCRVIWLFSSCGLLFRAESTYYSLLWSIVQAKPSQSGDRKFEIVVIIQGVTVRYGEKWSIIFPEP